MILVEGGREADVYMTKRGDLDASDNSKVSAIKLPTS